MKRLACLTRDRFYSLWTPSCVSPLFSYFNLFTSIHRWPFTHSLHLLHAVTCTRKHPELILSTLADLIGIVTSVIRSPWGQSWCPVVTTLGISDFFPFVEVIISQMCYVRSIFPGYKLPWSSCTCNLSFILSAGTQLFSSSFWSNFDIYSFILL